MHEIVGELLNYLQSAARFKWLAAMVAWLVCLGGWVYVSQMPDRFEANARVHVDTRSVLRPLLVGLTISPDVSGRIRLMSKLMFSRPNLEKVARMTDLDLGVKSDSAMETLVARLQKSMSISGGESDLFTIGFQDPDPKVAKKVVQSLLTIFVEQTLGESREDSNTAQKFLDQQIKEYEQRLLTAEKAREDFKRSNLGLLPEQGKNLYEELSKLSELLEQTTMAVQEATRRRDEMKRQLDEEPATITTDAGGDEYGEASAAPETGATSPLAARLQSMEDKLAELSLKYTLNHPEIGNLKATIAQLKRQKAKEDEDAAEDAAVAPEPESASAQTVANPVHQQKKLVLGEIEANLASLNSRAKIYQDKINILKQQMDQRLKIETELAALSRDYATVQENYGALLARREQARMSENVEQNTDSVKFKIVDPPQVPTVPAAPNRVLLSSGVLIGGIVAGLGLALFMALLRPAYTSTQKLRDATGLPVLGSVSMNWIEQVRKQKWRQFLGFIATYAMLLLVFAAVIALELKGHHLPTFI